MLYNVFYDEDVPWIKAQVEAALGRLNNSKPIYSGLYVPSLNPEDLAKAIQLSKEGGAKGVSFFDYGAIKDEHWAVIEKVLKS
jgi:hypothetical protein